MKPTNPSVTITPSRVLIFENDEYLLISMVSYLVMDGYEVTGVRKAEEFQKHLSSHSFCVAILGVDLPDNSGLLLTEFVQKNSTLRIITLSNNSYAGNRMACLNAGADIYLIKPFNYRLLSASVGILLRRSYTVPWMPSMLG